MFGLDRKISLFLIGLCFLLIYNIKSLKIWSSTTGPLEGFLPLLCTLVLLVCAVLLLLTESNEKQKNNKEKNISDEFKPILFFLFMFISIILMEYIGYILSFAIFFIGTLMFIQKFSLLKTMQLYLILIAFVYVTFIWWLDVPLPVGSIWESLLY